MTSERSDFSISARACISPLAAPTAIVAIYINQSTSKVSLSSLIKLLKASSLTSNVQVKSQESTSFSS